MAMLGQHTRWSTVGATTGWPRRSCSPGHNTAGPRYAGTPVVTCGQPTVPAPAGRSRAMAPQRAGRRARHGATSPRNPGALPGHPGLEPDRAGCRRRATAMITGELPGLNRPEASRCRSSGLHGLRPVPEALVVDWANLFDLPGWPPAQRARAWIDGRLDDQDLIGGCWTAHPAWECESMLDYGRPIWRSATASAGRAVGCLGRGCGPRLGSSRSPEQGETSASRADSRRRRSDSTCSRRPSTAAGTSALARAGWPPWPGRC